MEDSHICCTTLDNNVSVFGVFDGHGGTSQITITYPRLSLLINNSIGQEVALYTKDKFIAELQKLKSFKNKEYGVALKEAFIAMDELIKSP